MNIYIVNAFVWMLEFTSPGSLLRHFVLLVSSRSSMKSKELCRTPWRWGPDMNLAVETEALTFMWTWHVSSIAPGCGGSASATTCREDRWGTRQKWTRKCREDRRFVVPSTPKRYQRYPSKRRSSECPKWLRPWLRRWSRIRRCFCGSWQICEGKPRIWLGWNISVTTFSVVLGPSCGSAKACGPTQSRAEHLPQNSGDSNLCRS